MALLGQDAANGDKERKERHPREDRRRKEDGLKGEDAQAERHVQIKEDGGHVRRGRHHQVGGGVLLACQVVGQDPHDRRPEHGLRQAVQPPEGNADGGQGEEGEKEVAKRRGEKAERQEVARPHAVAKIARKQLPHAVKHEKRRADKARRPLFQDPRLQHGGHHGGKILAREVADKIDKRAKDHDPPLAVMRTHSSPSPMLLSSFYTRCPKKARYFRRFFLGVFPFGYPLEF